MRTKFTTSLAVILILLISGFTDEDKFAEGVAAYAAQDYKTAVTKFTVLAANNHAHAQLYLAEMYKSGQGVTRDYEAGHAMMLSSAENGNAEAAYRLGLEHDRIFAEKDSLEKAIPWYERAAEKGHKKSLGRLAELYKIESGEFANKEKYLHWLHKAAEANHAGSMYELAFLYNDGTVIEADHAEAIRLTKGAAKYGDAEAQFNLSLMYIEGRGVEANQDEAFKWLIWSAANKWPPALHQLGIVFLQRQGATAQDIENGLDAIEEAAELDYMPAHMTMSEIYGLGIGVEKDLQTALSWAYVAKENGLKNPDEIIAKVIARYEIPSSIPHEARKQATRCLNSDYRVCMSNPPHLMH